MEPEIHHIGHPFERGMACCDIVMPPEQLDVRIRRQVELCRACASRFKTRKSGKAVWYKGK